MSERSVQYRRMQDRRESRLLRMQDALEASGAAAARAMAAHFRAFDRAVERAGRARG